MYTQSVVLQAATTIAKTTETVIGAAIDVTKAEMLTLFLTYTKGDETGCNITFYFLGPSNNEHPLTDWTVVTGTYTGTAIKAQFLATATRTLTLDVSGQRSIKIYQAGSNNDGTPTGTLAVSYDIKE